MAALELDFLTDPTPGLPDFAGSAMRDNPNLKTGLKVAQTYLQRTGIFCLSSLTPEYIVTVLGQIQKEVATSLGITASSVRELASISSKPNLGQFQHTANDPWLSRRAILIGQHQLGIDGHLTPSAVAETVVTGLALRFALETVEGKLEIFTSHQKAAAETAALLSRTLGVRMDHSRLPYLTNGGLEDKYRKTHAIEYGLKHNTSTICVGNWPNISALGIVLISLRDPWIGYLNELYAIQNPLAYEAYKYGFYTKAHKETSYSHLLGLRALEDGVIDRKELASNINTAILSTSEPVDEQSDKVSYALALLDEWGRFFLGNGANLTVGVKADKLLQAGLIPEARGEHITEEDKTSLTLSRNEDGSLLLTERYFRSQPHPEAEYDLVPHHDMVKTFSLKRGVKGKLVIALEDFHSPETRLTVFAKEDAPRGLEEISGVRFHAQNKIGFGTERGVNIQDINRLLFMLFTGFTGVSLDQQVI